LIFGGKNLLVGESYCQGIDEKLIEGKGVPLREFIAAMVLLVRLMDTDHLLVLVIKIHRI